ncbi:neuroglobin-like [Liolophura sinensis]|uniref:neuroglobin-like n=1 Tax=Liolophura sinensis TaxID=3198878 RepID=UPI003158BBBB
MPLFRLKNMGCLQSKKPTTEDLLEKRARKESMVSRIMYENRPDFKEEYKVIILQTWTIIAADIARVGVVTFLRLFEMHPDVQDLFLPFRGMTQDDLKSSARLREHGLRVMGTVEKCLARLDDPQKLEEMLHELGQKHVMFNTKVDYIDLIGPTFLKVIQPALGDKWTYKVEQAWAEFFKLISHMMKESMVF